MPHEHAGPAGCVAVAVTTPQPAVGTFHPFLQNLSILQPSAWHTGQVTHCGPGCVWGLLPVWSLGAGKFSVFLILWLCVTAEDPVGSTGKMITPCETRIRRCFHKITLLSQGRWEHLGESMVLCLCYSKGFLAASLFTPVQCFLT